MLKLRLRKIDFRESKLRSFITSSFLIFVFLTLLIYFTAIVALIDDTPELQNYTNIYKFICLMSLLIFTVFSTIMYSRYVIEDKYGGKQSDIPPGYPASREKIRLVKPLTVIGFTTTSMLICTFLPIIIFSITESFNQIVPDELTLNVMITAIRNIIILSPIASMLGLVAMRIGLNRQSMSVAIIVALILVALIGDILANAYNNSSMGILILAVAIFIGLLTLLNLMRSQLKV